MCIVTCFACGFHGNSADAQCCWECGSSFGKRPAARWLFGDLVALAVVAWMIVAVPMSIQPQAAQAGSYRPSASARDACARTTQLVDRSWQAYRAQHYRDGVTLAEAARKQAAEACDLVPIQHAMIGFALSARAWNEHFTAMSDSITDMNAAQDRLDICASAALLNGSSLQARCEKQEEKNYTQATAWDAETPTSA